MAVESTEAWRVDQIVKLQEHYKDFRDFYIDVSEELLGFTPSDMQLDIALYMMVGPTYSMVQAARSEAKTTIAGCYAIWRLIHDPAMAVLILSAGASLAKEISTWCIQILNNMDILEVMRCDRSHPGARSSVDAYDLHHELKGANKSPSLKCMGITANLAGTRADLLIPDDIESPKNSQTQGMRENLVHLSREFTSICQKGKILYLGTPQSIDSVYNGLPSRGFDVKIWTGRFPTPEERIVYGEHLAPYIASKVDKDPTLGSGGGMVGTRGKPTDTVMLNEEILVHKEIDQGQAYFNLQYMLNTALADEDRNPLKLRNIMFYDFDLDECPGKFTWSMQSDLRVQLPQGFPLTKETLFRPLRVSPDYFPYMQKIISIDPGGTSNKHGDETGISVLYECNGYIVVMYNTGILGGNTPENLETLCSIIKRYNVSTAVLERNMGAGTFTESLKGAFLEHRVQCNIEEVWSSGQKEMRIINSLEPIISNHRLLINAHCLEHDIRSTSLYPAEKRSGYSLFFQLSKLTRDRGSLMHDDRLESVSQGVTFLKEALAKDAESQIAIRRQEELTRLQSDPRSIWFNSHTQQSIRSNQSTGNVFGRFNY